MTKEEKIKEAWDNKDGLNTNSWAKYYTYESVKHALTNNGSLFMPSDSYFDSGSYLTPPQIIGIENNNGWIKIKSEADLPITELNKEYYFIILEKELNEFTTVRGWTDKTGKYFINNQTYSAILYEDMFYKVTHYQPIEKPKPPIY